MHVTRRTRGLAPHFRFPSRAAVLLVALFLCAPGYADLAKTIQQVKPSIVGVGTFQKTRSPSAVFFGTGFAVADGTRVVTNAHVIPSLLDVEKKEALIVLVKDGSEIQVRSAELDAMDRGHDLALLKIGGAPLPALSLADSDTVREGQSLAFTGFPIGMALGLHPATHRGIVSAITPIVLPGLSSRQLDVKMVKRLREGAFNVFQLDATAYPGNSGSPLYDPETGSVYGIVNMVFVKGTKETALTQPSGISYAIPANYIRDLLKGRSGQR